MSSESPLVHVERRDDGVAVVPLDNPKVNALSSGVLGQLEAAADGLTEHPPGAVVVTGGDRIFAAGADISEFGGPDEARVVGGAFRRALDALAAIPRVRDRRRSPGSPWVAAASWRWPATCASRRQRAKFGQPEILLGIIPGGGGTQRLARLVGPARAKELILTGRQVGADEALRIGLVDEVVAHDELTRPGPGAGGRAGAGAVVAQALAKRAIDEGLDGTLSAGLALEQQLFAEVFATEDARIGVAVVPRARPRQGLLRRAADLPAAGLAAGRI